MTSTHSTDSIQQFSAPARALVLTYGLVTYAGFLAIFLYIIGFLGGFGVPRTINEGPFGEGLSGFAVNAALLGLFAVQHTIMARPAFKRWWTRFVPEAVERTTFVSVTCAILGVLVWQWRAYPSVVWETQGLVANAILAVSAIGWGIVLLSTFLIDHFHLFGVKQVVACAKGQPPLAPIFVERSLYRVVRHPLMLGFLIAFWAAPVMTVGHLFFAVMCTGYVLIALYIEEATLIELHGEDYEAYRKRVPKLFPRLLPR
jgi:protein-S-isoprenylcysteine O-methyltransferase Ste14